MVRFRHRDIYWLISAGITASTVVIAGFLTIPRIADAFWPFSTPASGAELAQPIIHDSTLALLEGANNPDPNPFKGGLEVEITEGSALIANVGPEGSIAEPGSVQNGGRISLYVVREGDTLSEIADMFGVSPNTIKWANDIKNLKLIAPGRELLILPITGVKHTVKSGDTLGSLAKKYSADADEIAFFNDLDGEVALVPGVELIIPGGEVPAPKVTSSGGGGGGTALPAISGFFGNPVPGARLTQGLHGYNGIDLGAPSGTPVYASAGGTVIVARSGGGWNGGYGNYIVIDHGNGTQTLYAHLSSVSVGVGASVGKGERIGGVGRTGKATGNHLHFEVRGARNPFAP